MEQATVQKIADLAIAAQGAMPIQVDGNASIAVIPESFKVINTEKFNPLRDRFRGAFSTVSISSFVEYVQNRKIADVKAFVSTQRGLDAQAVFNLGDENAPGHADDTALLSLEKKPEFKALEKIDGDRFNQQELIDWLDDWADFLTARNAEGEQIPHEKALRALRRVKINRSHEADSNVQDLGYNASVTEQAEATGVDENLPNHLTLATESYKGLSVENLKISLRISFKEANPTFVLRFVGKDAHEQRRAEEFTNLLQEQLMAEVAFYQGSFTA